MKLGRLAGIPLFWALLFSLPGVWSVFLILDQGPRAWSISQQQPWGVPVACFVFWVGLAHAGTFFSAVLLLLGKEWREPLAQHAERATLAALVAAALYPLLHLGAPLGALLMVPQMDVRGIGLQPTSPLFWDMMAIASYGFVSLGFYLLERYGQEGEAKWKRLRLLAWILVPLVVSVHTIVSLDFATVRLQAWAQAWLPFYFIAGALFSGVAWMVLWCETPRIARLLSENKQGALARLRMGELLLGMSWLLAAFWILSWLRGNPWDWGLWWTGFVIPQLLWWSRFSAWTPGRIGVALSVLGAMLWERLHFVLDPLPDWQWMDLGWLCVGFFVFFTVLTALDKNFRIAPVELRPWRVVESLGVAFLGGGCVLVLGGWWYSVTNGQGTRLSGYAAPQMWNLWPALLPLVLAAGGAMILLWAPRFSLRRSWRALVLGAGLGASLAGAVFFLPPNWEERWTRSLERSQRVDWSSPDWVSAPDFKGEGRPVADLWNGYCSVCHGATGSEKMPMRRHYPPPPKIRESQWNAQGTDSLVQVVLHGRGYMNAYAGRVSPEEARSLVLWMHMQLQLREGGKGHE